MGHINRFNLTTYIKEYNTNIFVETGTGEGGGFGYVLKYPFKHLYTIEIVEELFNKTKNKFSEYKNCTFINNNSKDGLKKVINEISNNDIVCFWLDAHFPGADFNLATYDSTKDNDLRIPLESELRLLKEIRDTKNDVLIIDDLRIYEDGPFTAGIWSDRKKLGGNGIDFIYELFGLTHNIQKDYRDQGYILLTPKK